MFLEPRINKNTKSRIGWIEVVCGSMFSGKTEELIRRVNRAAIAKQNVIIFKPAVDIRYSEEEVVSHNKNSVTSIPISHAHEILDHVEGYEVIAIDEAQFFSEDLVEICSALANKGYRVIVSGLDMDFMGRPFGPIPHLMSISEYVTKLHAICMQCGDVALYSYRLVDSEQKVLLGELNEYEARCRKCFHKGMKNREVSSSDVKEKL